MASKPENDAEKDSEDDFVVLEKFDDNAMTGSTGSNASTIPEKQAFESQEKQSASLEDLSMDSMAKSSDSYVSLGESNSDSFSSLGSSTINEKPYYESSRFIEKQFALERKLGVLGEGRGKEKMDECRGEDVGERSERKQGDKICSGESGEGRVRSGGEQGTGEVMGTGDVTDDGSGAKAGHVKEGVGEGRVRGGSKVMKLDTGRGETSCMSGEVKGLAGKDEVNVDGDEGAKIENECTIEVPCHVEDIPSCEKTKISKEHSNAEPETLVDTQLQEDHPGSESIVAKTSNDGTCQVATDSGPSDDSVVSNLGPNQEPSSLPRDSQHKEMDEGHGEPGGNAHKSSGNLAHSDPSQGAEHNAPITPSQASQDPPSCQTHPNIEDEPEEDSKEPDDGTHSGNDTGRTQDVPMVSQQVDEPQQGSDHEQQNIPTPDKLSPVAAPQRRALIGNNGQDAPNEDHQHPPRRREHAQERAQQQQADVQRNQQPDERPPDIHQRRVLPNRRAPCCLWILPVLVAVVAVVGWHMDAINLFWSTKVQHPKPVVEITSKTHVSPSISKTLGWKLQGKCKAHNTSYTIRHCQWRQIHPLPTSHAKTIFPGGTKDCPHLTSSNHPSTHEVDASLEGLPVPTDLRTYTFELACGHDVGNSAAKRIEIWVNELVPPVISVTTHKVTVSTSTGIAVLDVSCSAMQGRIVERKWEHIDSPGDPIVPSENGVLHVSTPGIYMFKYRCTDNFGGTALSSLITIHAKPPYVLGIDLGTSTTCIAVIKENGTRRDIGIYEGENDMDPCMPSVVAFAQNGDLLIGEKALQQAMISPHSTIYEAKRLMGRSYYDEVNMHKFLYRVRPTLKSHSLKGVRAAIEIPCGKFGKKLVQPELISALILRHVSDLAQRYLDVDVKDVVISVPAQFDDAQRKATMDAGLIAGLNPIKIVNEPTVAAFAANNLTEKLLAAAVVDDGGQVDNGEEESQRHPVWAVVADIGGGTTDYALMQIHGFYYKVITTDGNKILGGRDIDIRLGEVMTRILQEKYPSLDLTSSVFQQKLRIECENAKIVLSKKEQYDLTVEYVDEDEHVDSLPLGYLLTRDEFEGYVGDILDDMVKPIDSLLSRAGGKLRETLGQGIKPENIEDLYLVGGTSHIPKLKKLLLSKFQNMKNVRHEDPVQLVSRGAAAFGAALTGLVQVGKAPLIDAVPLPISIAVDMDDMHVIFERNRLYPCIEKRVLTTYTNNQNAIIIKVYEGEGRTANECHFLGEFELSGIPPLPKNIPQIEAIFKIDSNGILSVKASYGSNVKAMKLDVYSKSGAMIHKTRDKMHLVLSKLMSPRSLGQAKCEMLEDATPMSVIPVEPKRSNVLKLSVDSEYDSIKMVDSSDPSATIPAVAMVTVQGLVTDYESVTKEADLDIVLVVDISGSMAGAPIETMKKIILHLIDRLKENHRLGIVTYSTNVDRNLQLVSGTAENKERARNIVHAFRTMGSTNLYGGLETGLEMAYNGQRRSRVLLFTDGEANDGKWIENGDIIREINRKKIALGSVTQAQVTLSTFGYLDNHNEDLLQNLATTIGGGSYNFLNENTEMGRSIAMVLGDAIHTVAENIKLTIAPLDDVQIIEAITHFQSRKESEKFIFEIPNTADQQSRHILLRLAVPPAANPSVHAGVYRVELTYTNTLTEREEGSEEYLYVARTATVDLEAKSQDVGEQLNRVQVATSIGRALEALKTDQNNRADAAAFLKQAHDKINNSGTKGRTLSVCLNEDLEQLIQEVEHGDLNTAMKSLQDSLTSHWQEKGGRGSCYVTRKEDKLISIFTS